MIITSEFHIQRFDTKQERDLLDKGLNRVTDTCIPEEEAFRRLQGHIFELWKTAENKRAKVPT